MEIMTEETKLVKEVKETKEVQLKKFSPDAPFRHTDPVSLLEERFFRYVSFGRYEELKSLLESIEAEPDGQVNCNHLSKKASVYEHYYRPALSVVTRVPIEGDEPVEHFLDLPEERERRKQIIKLLLTHGANPLDLCYYDRTALQNARYFCLFSAPLFGLDEDLITLCVAAGMPVV